MPEAAGQGQGTALLLSRVHWASLEGSWVLWGEDLGWQEGGRCAAATPVVLTPQHIPCNRSSCAHSWSQEASACSGDIRPGSRLRELPSTEPGTTEHSSLQLFLHHHAELPGRETEGKGFTICTTSSRVIWLSPGSSCVRVLWQEKAALP